MKSKYSISVVVPVYNEIILIRKSVIKIQNFIKKYFDDYELLIIESGSTDGTENICDELDNKNKNINVMHEGGRNGLGSALKLGFKNATKDLVLAIVVDMPFPLESILEALPYFEKYDCILSYRSNDNRNWFRKFQSFIFNLIIKLSLGLKVKHVNSAFKFYKRKTIQNMNLISNGWFIDAEIIYNLQKMNIPYFEMPVELIDRNEGKSTLPFFIPLKMLSELLVFKKSIKNS